MRTYLPLVILVLLAIPTFIFAAENLINLPSAAGFSGSRFNQYINTVYAMFISTAALLAVVKIIIAGVKYMFSDIATQKSDAKRDIRTALLGLLVVLAAVLILTVINPNLTGFDLSLTKTSPPPKGSISYVTVGGSGDLAGVLVDSNLKFKTSETDCTAIKRKNCSINNILDNPYLCVAGNYDLTTGMCSLSSSVRASLLTTVELDNIYLTIDQYTRVLNALKSAHGDKNVSAVNLGPANKNTVNKTKASCVAAGRTNTNEITIVQGPLYDIYVVCF